MEVAAGAAVSTPAARLSPDSEETAPAPHCATIVPPAADSPVPSAFTAGPFHDTVNTPLTVIGPPDMPVPDVPTEATPPPGAPAGPALPAGPLRFPVLAHATDAIPLIRACSPW